MDRHRRYFLDSKGSDTKSRYSVFRLFWFFFPNRFVFILFAPGTFGQLCAIVPHNGPVSKKRKIATQLSTSVLVGWLFVGLSSETPYGKRLNTAYVIDINHREGNVFKMSSVNPLFYYSLFNFLFSIFPTHNAP